LGTSREMPCSTCTLPYPASRFLILNMVKFSFL
jgi:hypothetical protein